jgi:hypothetical protein
MQFRLPAFALCLVTVVTISFGGGVASAQEGQTPPNFPPNYKARIAARLVPNYLNYGEGQPEISNIYNRTGLLGASVSVCVQYPYKKKAGLPPDAKYKFLISGNRNVFSLGQNPLFTLRRLGSSDKCGDAVTPFRELERAAQLVKGCKGKGETRCVVNQEAGRRDTVVIRPKWTPPAGPRLNPPN